MSFIPYQSSQCSNNSPHCSPRPLPSLLSPSRGLTMVREKPNCPPLPPLTIPRSRWWRAPPAVRTRPQILRSEDPIQINSGSWTLDTRYFSLQRSNNPNIFYGFLRFSKVKWKILGLLYMYIFGTITLQYCVALLPMYQYLVLVLSEDIPAHSCRTRHLTFVNFLIKPCLTFHHQPLITSNACC